jgi:hypothetical protein
MEKNALYVHITADSVGTYILVILEGLELA